MQGSAQIRTPTWFSSRRIFEQKLEELHKCNNLRELKQIHALIYKHNLHQDLYIAPKLVTAYSICRQVNLAVRVFNQVEFPNVHLYNTVIRAHINNSQHSQAFQSFIEMQSLGILPDNFTYPFLLKACSGKSSFDTIRMIHCHTEKHGLKLDIFIPNSLIDSYSKCGKKGVRVATELFDRMEEKDIVSWNSMISGLIKAGDLKHARKLFDEMPMRDAVSWNTIVDGYAKAGQLDAAFELFKKMPTRNVVSWSTMISGYSKAGDMETARMLFDKMPAKNLVTWTIIISGYAEKGCTKEAVSLYKQMEEAGLPTDDGTIISILAACAESGLLGLGKKVHNSIEKSKYRCNTNIWNALIDMYAKCGSLNKAFSIFSNMPKKDLISYNAMIHGLAMHGNGRKALDLFSKLEQDKLSPDKVTFVGVLCACTHGGFLDEGIRYFYSMGKDYGIVPEIEHYGCMIDLLGRGGKLEEAFRLVHNMPVEPNVTIWGALLAACRKHNDVELAEEVLNHMMKLDPTNAGNLSMLSNIYAAAGDWDGVAATRLKMKSMNSQKHAGASSIELDEEVHEFTVKDESHPKAERIYQMIGELNLHLKQIGYVPKASY